jgi:hypothetical protein
MVGVDAGEESAGVDQVDQVRLLSARVVPVTKVNPLDCSAGVTKDCRANPRAAQDHFRLMAATVCVSNAIGQDLNQDSGAIAGAGAGARSKPASQTPGHARQCVEGDEHEQRLCFTCMWAKAVSC